MATYLSALRVLLMGLCLSGACCVAQSTSFGLSSASGSPGSTVNLDISMDPNPGSSPASAEWTLSYPVTDFTSATVTAGSVAAEANKSVSCTNVPGSATCVLWGDNNTAMGSGVVATVALVVSGTTQDQSSQVQLVVPAAADPSGFSISASATGGVVTILQPAALTSFSCVPVSLIPTTSSTCTLDLTGPAPSGGASISLSASPSEVVLPATVTIAPGANSAVFTVSPVLVHVSTPTTLDASYLGVNEGFGLIVNPLTPALTGITIAPSVLGGGMTLSGTVTLSASAGAGGVAVQLSSSNALAISVPPSITIPQGSTSAPFSLTTVNVLAPTPVVVAGTYSGTSVTANLTVVPRPHALSAVQINPTTIESGQTATGTVTLAAPAGVGGASVGLFCSQPAALILPSSVVVPQGAVTASFNAVAGTVRKTTAVTITAYRAGLKETATLTLTPAP